MNILIFRAADVRRVVEHALAAKEHARELINYDANGEPVTKAGKPAVILVHDQGVYLMSNGEPRDLRSEGSVSCYVAYATGCDPDKDADWYDTARDLVGGDDFGETLPWAEEIKRAIDAGATTIRIKVGTNRLELEP